MISPFYPLTVSQFLGVMVPEEIVVNVAMCGLASVKAFSRRGKCHGDIKPSNMMFGAHDNVIVTIDFGSSSSCDDEASLNATTAAYCLNARENTLDFDLTCLASSICHLSLLSLDNNILSQNDLRNRLAREAATSLGCRIAFICLENAQGIDHVWNKTLEVVNLHQFSKPAYFGQSQHDLATRSLNHQAA